MSWADAPARTTGRRERAAAAASTGPGGLRPADDLREPSTILLKVAMAASGVLLHAFVLVHMVGNLKVYLGAEALDAYAAWLLDLFHPVFPEAFLVWTLRLVLLVAVGVHVVTAAVLARRNRAATGGAVRRQGRQLPGSHAARTMPLTGVAILLFVVLHLLDMTIGTANPDFVRGDVHANLVASLRRPLVSLAYVAAMLALGSHLLHGLWSAVTSLGLTGTRVRAGARALTVGLVAVVVVGNVSIPIAVLLGIVS